MGGRQQVRVRVADGHDQHQDNCWQDLDQAGDQEVSHRGGEARRRALQVHGGEGDRPDKDADQAVERGHQESGAVGERQSKDMGNQADRPGYAVDNHSRASSGGRRGDALRHHAGQSPRGVGALRDDRDGHGKLRQRVPERQRNGDEQVG